MASARVPGHHGAVTTAVSLARFNADPALAREVLGACLDVPRWVDAVDAARPFPSRDTLVELGDRESAGITWPEVAAALARHPRIGEKRAAVAGTAAESAWSASEQSGVQESEADRLAAGNLAYEARFGHIFLICASGLTGSEILESLRDRLTHDDATEQSVVIGELRKIAALRLAKAVVG